MRRLLGLMALMMLAAGCDARRAPAEAGIASGSSPGAPSTDLLARWHFVGKAALAGNTNATILHEVWKQPTTQKLVRDALDKLARAPQRLLQAELVATNADLSPWLTPLLEDLLEAESFGECRGTPQQVSAWVLGVRVEDARARLWSTNWAALAAAFGAGGLSPWQDRGWSGWEAQRSRPPQRVRWVRAGAWVVVAWEPAPLARSTEILNHLRTTGKPEVSSPGEWFELEANMPSLAGTLGLPREMAWPQALWTMSGRGESLRSSLRMSFAQPLGVKLEPWQMPTNTVKEPLISFSAVQGLKPWLTTRPAYQQAGLGPAPNQVFCWAQGLVPFQTYLAWAMAGRTNTLRALVGRLPEFFKQQIPTLPPGNLTFNTNTWELLWHGLPIVVPFLKPAPEPQAEFVTAGLFPPAAGKRLQSAPPELYAQVLGRPNLVYYGWEMTEMRVPSWQSLFSLYDVAMARRLDPTNTPARSWLSDTNITSKLGNAATELTLASPRELRASRSSALGFTGVELVALARWLENRAFPAYQPPDLLPIFKRALAPSPAAPAPR